MISALSATGAATRNSRAAAVSRQDRARLTVASGASGPSAALFTVIGLFSPQLARHRHLASSRPAATTSKSTRTGILDSSYEIGKFVSVTPLRRFSRNPVSLRALHRSMAADRVFSKTVLISRAACDQLNISLPPYPRKEDCMSLRTAMQAGPAKANELFARLLDTSDGAVKTREKLFTELKTELELHTSLEEQHLFPVLRRNAETKELVTEAIKDNKDLRAKLAELEALPKNDEAFPERLKELQKTFRQHARDEKRELLPAVQRALSEEQIQGVAEKIEAGVAEAEQGREDELEALRLKARQERERAERQSERQAEAEREQQAAAEKTRQEEAEQKRAKARQEREEATHQAEQEAAARQGTGRGRAPRPRYR